MNLKAHICVFAGFGSVCIDIPAPPPLFTATHVVATPQNFSVFDGSSGCSSPIQNKANLKRGGVLRASPLGKLIYKAVSFEDSMSKTTHNAVVKQNATVTHKAFWEWPFTWHSPHDELLSTGSSVNKVTCYRRDDPKGIDINGVAADACEGDSYGRRRVTFRDGGWNNSLPQANECPLMSVAASSELLQRQHQDILRKRSLQRQKKRSALKTDSTLCGRRDPSIPYCRLKRWENSLLECPEDLFKGFLS